MTHKILAFFISLEARKKTALVVIKNVHKNKIIKNHSKRIDNVSSFSLALLVRNVGNASMKLIVTNILNK